jgi:hypothetical protein
MHFLCMGDRCHAFSYRGELSVAQDESPDLTLRSQNEPVQDLIGLEVDTSASGLAQSGHSGSEAYATTAARCVSYFPFAQKAYNF